jgi:hypothetical protein
VGKSLFFLTKELTIITIIATITDRYPTGIPLALKVITSGKGKSTIPPKYTFKEE